MSDRPQTAPGGTGATRAARAPAAALALYAAAVTILWLVSGSVAVAYLGAAPPSPAEAALAGASAAVMSGALLWGAARSCARGAEGRRILRRSTGTALPARRPLAWIVLSPLAALVALALAFAVHETLLALGLTDPPSQDSTVGAVRDAPLLGQVALSFFVAALPEELVFRGALLVYLLRREAASGRRTVAAVAATSLLFGLLHAPAGAEAFAQTSVSSVVYATLAVLSRSLWPAVAAHGTFDVIVFAGG